jgi:hypothetical protein
MDGQGAKHAEVRAAVRWLALLLVVGTATAPAAGYDWVIEVVDGGKTFSEMTDRSLRLDAQGHPHIAYGEDQLYYAFHDGSAWQHEVADSSGGVGLFASLALDSSGHPHISYYDRTDYDLKYAYRDASAAWHAETVDEEGDVGLYTSLVLDAQGYPQVSYYDWANSDLKYAYRDASGWHIETVDAEGDVGECAALALDGSDHPHVSYCGWDEYFHNYQVKYAYHDASGWHTETVDTAGGWGQSEDQHTSLVLDGAGRPGISYYHYGDHELKHAYCDASGWRTETVESPFGPIAWASLAVDGSGWPHIGYCDWGLGDLKYACSDTSGWHTETVAATVGALYTSLALDGEGYPHISYQDWWNNDLKYARAEGQVVAHEGSVSAVPATPRLIGIWPHPVDSHVTILYGLGAGSEGTDRRVSLKIYDPLGRLLAAPVDHTANGGTHTTRWDLRSVTGHRVGPGVYCLRLEADNLGVADVARIVVVR